MFKKAAITVALMFPAVLFAQNAETINVVARVADTGTLMTTMSTEFAEPGKVVKGEIGSHDQLAVSAFSSSVEGSPVYGMTTVRPTEDSVVVSCKATSNAANDHKKIVTKVKFVDTAKQSSISCDRSNLESTGRFPTYGQKVEKITVILADSE